MFAFIVFLFAVYGMSNAIAHLKVGAPIRLAFSKIPILSQLVQCTTCVSFWIGLAVSAFVLSPAALIATPGWRSILLDGLAASGFTYLVYVASERLADGLEHL